MQTRERSLATEPPPQTPRSRWLVPALAAAAAVVLAIVLVVFLSSADDASPDVVTTLPGLPSTTVPATPEAAARNQVAALVSAANAGDLGGVLAVLSPDAKCDVSAAGTRTETCEQFWGANIAMGGRFDMVCAGATLPFSCSLDMMSESHTALGYPDHVVSSTIPVEIDAEGLLVTGPVSGTRSNFSGGGDATDFRWWRFMQGMFPEMPISGTFGPNPYDAAAGAAMLEAARAMNDPIRLAAALEEAIVTGDFSELDGFITTARCNTDVSTGSCRDLIPFLQSVDASLAIDCPNPAVDGAITCEMSMFSDIHESLGSGPSTFDGTIEFRGGTVQGLTLDLAFSEDLDEHLRFLESARSRPDLYEPDGERPIFTSDTAPLWLQAAQAFEPEG